MGQPPLPDALAVGGAAEVVAVLRLGQPAGLPGGFGRLAADFFGAVLLVPAVAGVGEELLIATQALAGGGGTHRQGQNAPPSPLTQPSFEKKILPPPPTKKTGKKTQEEEFCQKLSKKIQRKRHPVFKPPSSSGFQIAARRERGESGAGEGGFRLLSGRKWRVQVNAPRSAGPQTLAESGDSWRLGGNPLPAPRSSCLK